MLGWMLVASSLLACHSGSQGPGNSGTDPQPPSPPLIVAHRGGMDSGQPENTLPAFRSAAAAGADVVELDLRATRDGHPVVMHDHRVNRTTNGRGAIHRMKLKKLKRLDAGDGVRVPTFDEVLDDQRARGVDLLVDMKPARHLDHAAVVGAVSAADQISRVIFGVRSLQDHARLTAAHPDVRLLGFARTPRQIDGFLEAGVEAVRLWPGWVRRDPDLVERVRAAGAEAWVTAGNAPPGRLRKLAALGVRGLLTDRPGEAAASLRPARDCNG